MATIKDLTGKRFGKLQVLCDTKKRKHKHVVWLCMCDCGNRSEVTGNNLTKGSVKSCGCTKKHIGAKGNKNPNYKHGMKGTRIYVTWHGMKDRCYNKNNKEYKNYGERGITVCDKWQTFSGFYEDMKDTYSDKLTLDRVDVNGNYNKENCRWATQKEQSDNKRTNRYETIDGITDTFTNHCRRYGIGYGTVITRLKYGWELEKAFKTPIKPHKKYKVQT